MKNANRITLVVMLAVLPCLSFGQTTEIDCSSETEKEYGVRMKAETDLINTITEDISSGNLSISELCLSNKYIIESHKRAMDISREILRFYEDCGIYEGDIAALKYQLMNGERKLKSLKEMFDKNCSQ